MDNLVLVAYATRYGSTEETARMVAAVLQANGLAVDVQPVADVQAWKPYAVVVLAAALYVGRLHKEARRFLARWRGELERTPIALLVPGPVGDDQKGWKSAEQQLAKEVARTPWLHPIEQKIVGGKFDPQKLSRLFRWLLRKIPANDARDWNAIRSWAREIVGKLQPTITTR